MHSWNLNYRHVGHYLPGMACLLYRGINMKENKLLKLKAREINIVSRERYRESPGVLAKVRRQIKNLEKE